MTDYEVLMVFYEVTDDLNSIVGLYISMVAAFLFLGLFFGHVLNRLTTGIVIFIYISMMTGVIERMNGACAVFEDVIFQLHARSLETDSAIGWLSNFAPNPFTRSFSETTTVTLTLAVLASIVFFFQTRKLDPKNFR